MAGRIGCRRATPHDLRIGGAPAQAPRTRAAHRRLVAVARCSPWWLSPRRSSLRDGSEAGRRRRVASAAPSPRRRPGRRRGWPGSPTSRCTTARRRRSATASSLPAGTSGGDPRGRDAAGQQVKARRLTDAAAPGKRLEADVPIDLAARTLHLRAAARRGRREAPPRRRVRRRRSGLRRLRLRGARRARAAPAGLPRQQGRRRRLGLDPTTATAMSPSRSSTPTARRRRLSRARAFQLASLSKAILLVASLRDDPTPDAATEATLTRMITESDNGAANAIFAHVGAKGMRAVAKVAGMQDYEQGSGWIDTRVVRRRPGALLLAARVARARRGARPRAARCSRASSPSSAGASRRRPVPRAGRATSRAAGWAWTTSS